MSNYPEGYEGSIAAPKSNHPEKANFRSWTDWEECQEARLRRWIGDALFEYLDKIDKGEDEY